MLKGITEVAKAWQILEKYYGNRHVTINTVITGLRNCTLTGTTSQASVPLPASPPGLHIPPTATCLAVPGLQILPLWPPGGKATHPVRGQVE